MSFESTEWVWMNGQCVRWNDASVHVSAHTLHLGSGVFEALRCYKSEHGPAVFRMDAHLDRLYDSAQVYDMKIPYTKLELEEAICETIRRNGFDICYVRLLCYHGSGSLGVFTRGCPVEVAILTWPLGAYLGQEGLRTGIRVCSSSWVKFHSRMMPTTAKAGGQYLNSLLALREAINRGCDESLLLDLEGNIAEGSGENIFIVKDGKLLTNDETSSILLGITRDSVIRLAADFGLPVEITRLRPDDLFSADEAFFTGTAAEVTPIREVDGVQIGRSMPGPVTEKIQKKFFKVTAGQDPKYLNWLFFVNNLVAGKGN